MVFLKFSGRTFRYDVTSLNYNSSIIILVVIMPTEQKTDANLYFNPLTLAV